MTYIEQKIENYFDPRGKWVEYFVSSILFCIIVLGIVVGFETLTTGYHLVDDWQYIKYNYQKDILGMSLSKAIRTQLAVDMNLRFRPLYYTDRIIWAYLLGWKSLLPYMIIKVFEIVATSELLYVIARKLGSKRLIAFLFVLVTIIGYQSAIWWKLGVHEAWAMLLFALGFLLIMKYLETVQKVYLILGFLVILSMSLYKESFIMLIPFIMLYIVYYEIEHNSTAPFWAGLWAGIRKHLFSEIILGLTFVSEVLYIYLRLGTNSTGYSGIDSTISPYDYIQIWDANLHRDLQWYLRFGILLMFIAMMLWEYLKRKWKEFILSLVLLLPQIALYLTTGFEERYIWPAILSFSGIMILVVGNLPELRGKKRIGYLILIVLMTCANFRAMAIEASYFTYRGTSVQTMLNTVSDMVTENPDLKVMSGLAPNNEANNTVHYYLTMNGWAGDIYCWYDYAQVLTPWENEAKNKTIPDVFEPGTGYSDNPAEDMDIVILYNHEDRHWDYDFQYDLSSFNLVKCGTLDVYIRK